MPIESKEELKKRYRASAVEYRPRRTRYTGDFVLKEQIQPIKKEVKKILESIKGKANS